MSSEVVQVLTIPANTDGGDTYNDCPQFHVRLDRFHRITQFVDGLILEIVVVVPAK